MGIPILEREGWRRRVGKRRATRALENNRRLAQEANAFGNEALGGKQAGMKGKGRRDGAIRVQGMEEEKKKWEEEM